jgi:hypothetical protein
VKKILIMMTLLTLTACSAPHMTRVESTVTDQRHINFNILVDTVQRNYSLTKPDQNLKNRLEELAFMSGLHRKCFSDGCFLVNPDNNAKIRIEKTHINIHINTTQHIVDDPHRAVQIIYG